MNRQALREIAEMAVNLPPEDVHMSKWVCDTKACIIGHAILAELPEIKRSGLKIMSEAMLKLPTDTSPLYQYIAVMHVLDIDERFFDRYFGTKVKLTPQQIGYAILDELGIEHI